MLRRLLAVLAAALLAAGLFLPACASAEETMYVSTQNGKGLNVRYEPRVGNNMVGSFPNGSRVTVAYHLENGWSAVYWAGDEICYVQSRFLTYSKGFTPSPSSGQPGDSANTAAEMNRIFKTYSRVARPYRVTVRPTRATGWVNMRFAPSKLTEVMGTYRDNEQLIVIAELSGWYQVEDPNTGAVGYMSSQFVIR